MIAKTKCLKPEKSYNLLKIYDKNRFIRRFEYQVKSNIKKRQFCKRNLFDQKTCLKKITGGGKDLETSSVTIPYAPPHSKRAGGLFLPTSRNKEKFFKFAPLAAISLYPKIAPERLPLKLKLTPEIRQNKFPNSFYIQEEYL